MSTPPGVGTEVPDWLNEPIQTFPLLRSSSIAEEQEKFILHTDGT